MAETLGSLVDKLSIKNLRIWHLDEVLADEETPALKREEFRAKRDLADKQRQELMLEVDGFLAAALRGEVRICDEKIKMYTNTNVSSSDAIKNLGEAVSELSFRNIKLWHLEDEARRTDLPDSSIVQTKRQIDSTNQERNNLMDKVDKILLNCSEEKP
jgi:hypothetical protein